jgi:hypothetical protein
LKRVASQGKTIVYRKAGQLVGLDIESKRDRDQLMTLLDEINRREHEAGRPLLSAVVVGYIQRVPGLLHERQGTGRIVKEDKIMKREITIGSVTVQMDDDGITFFRPGLAWEPGGTGARGNSYIGPISDPREARMVAYQLLLWAEEKARGLG